MLRDAMLILISSKMLHANGDFERIRDGFEGSFSIGRGPCRLPALPIIQHYGQISTYNTDRTVTVRKRRHRSRAGLEGSKSQMMRNSELAILKR